MRLVENLSDHYFFYTHGADGVFTYVSDSMSDMLGYSKEEFCTQYEEYLTNDPMNDKVSYYTELAISGKAQAPYQLNIYHKDGTNRYLEVSESPVFDSDGNVTYVDGIAKDITEQHYAQKELFHLARHDTLTLLSNRSFLEEEVQKLIDNSRRVKNDLALLFLDLDRFKQINDTLGHNIGDKLLQEVAKRIKPNIRAEDIFARIGGDEFVIVLNNINEAYLTTIINKIMGLMRTPWKIDTFDLQVSTSMGIALFPQDASNMIELMKNADIAMYKAKELGRDNFSFFTEELNKKVHHDMSLEQDMADALLSNQFVLYYQPKLELENNKIIGAEALVRWQHPDFGLIYPDDFIELAESTGFIIKLGTWIIEEACRAINRFNSYENTHILHLSVNISPRQLQNDDLYIIIKEALEENNIHPKQFSIEITEGIMIDNSDKMLKRLHKIKSLGINICLDDFGTGYSSLSYLNRLPISSLKIDKTFVDHIPKSGDEKILLNTIIAMGHTLGIGVIAEGVEEEYQRLYLISEDCLYYQGYLFSKAIPENEYINLLS